MVVKPSEKEEEYFVRMDFERRKKIEEEKQKKLAEEEKKRLKALHHMKCPKCGMELIEIDYQDIKILRWTSVPIARAFGWIRGNLSRCPPWKRRVSISFSTYSSEEI